MTTNTSYNPIFRATRAAITELTTPEAWSWYRQQVQVTAALTHHGFTLIQRWVSASCKPIAVVPVQTINQVSLDPSDNDETVRVHFMDSADQDEKVAAMQSKHNIKPLDSEQSVKSRPTVAQGAVENPAQFQDTKSLLTYYAYLNLDQNSEVPLDVAVHAFQSAQKNASTELNDVATDSNAETEPLGDSATNGLSDADSTDGQSETVESVAPAADLEPEPSALVATEPSETLGYEVLEDLQELPAETGDEPLLDTAILTNDELESGPPFLTDEDTSFFGPEDDSLDSLLEDDLEPVASVLPSDLNERVTAYLQAHRISPESDDLANSHSFTPATSHGSTGAEVGE